MKLTDVLVKQAKADPDKVVRLRDELGLYLEISPGGKMRSWRLRIRQGGRNTIKTLGHYPDMTLAKARLAQASIRKNDGDTSLTLDTPSFWEVTEKWIAKNLATEWMPSNAYAVETRLKKYFLKLWGAKKINSIRKIDITEEFERLATKGRLPTVHALREHIEGIFRYATQKGWLEKNPAEGLRTLLPELGLKVPRPAIIDLEPLREFLQKVESNEVALYSVTRLAHRFLALTATRALEYSGAKWDEFHNLDGEDPHWIIPAERMKGKRKKRREHVVPLARQSVDVLKKLKEINPPSEYLFPREDNPSLHRHTHAITIALHRNGFGGQHCPHGWRASFSSIMNSRRERDRPFIDLMLAHSMFSGGRLTTSATEEITGSRSESAYNRYKYMNIRAEIAQEWADILLEGSISLDELVVLRKKAKPERNTFVEGIRLRENGKFKKAA